MPYKRTTTRRKRTTRRVMVKRPMLVRNRLGAVRRFRQANPQWQAIGGKAGFGSVVSPFPPNMFTVVTYTETIQHNQTVGGTPTFLQYRANGPFDPRVASGGIQPRYYDSLLGPDGGTAPYRNYRVHASQITVTIYNTQTAVGTGFFNYAVIPSRSAINLPSSLDEMRERPYCKQIAVAPTPSWKPQKIKHYCKMKTHLGHKDLTDVDGSAAAFNAVPAEQVYWNLGICAVDNVSGAGCRVQVTIKYFLQLYTLADVADS